MELWLSALPVIGIPMLLVWVVSVIKRDAAVIDVYWGPGYGLVALWYLWQTPEPGLRGWLVTGAAVLWAARLGIHLGVRWWAKGEEDYRYAAMRADHPKSFPLRSLVTVFGLQAMLIWVFSPVLMIPISQPGDPGILAWLGLLCFGTGFAFEAVGDAQLAAFKADPANRGRVLDTGVWRYSRHPNYFGEALLWWGIYLVALEAGGAWTAYAPVAITILLLRISGVPLLEKRLVETRPKYAEYVRRTSAFIPRPPRPAR